jgi:hypothetical protein
VESESASAVAIAKETISRLATFRRTTLEEHINASEDACVSCLNLVGVATAYVGPEVMSLRRLKIALNISFRWLAKWICWTLYRKLRYRFRDVRLQPILFAKLHI